MEYIHNVHSTHRLPMLATVATGSRYSFNIEQHSETDECGRIHVYYTCDQYWFPTGQYNLVQNGMLPPGASEWTDALRSIERASLYREADDMLSKYSTDVPDQTKYDEWKQYKHAVRQTQEQQTYPQKVEYPERPIE